ncbi:RDD family protein [Vibrio sp. 10N.261.52.A1]|uniref:RDD family protein n=1 Tax=Vibrio TaxID=662 RepID=UPI000C833E9E|nr:RDD family protein [Vibrio sp. 10N.261.52.A1]PML58707.1 hypothetical protein BCT81_07750 [Vibrio sp. 10N.261.52.A1]
MKNNSDGVIKAYKLASPGRRYVGELIDSLISAIIFMLFLSLGNSIGLSQDITGWSASLIAASYFLLSDGLPRGQSLGKKLLGISVIDSITGENCSLKQSLFRNLLSPLLGIIDAFFILGKKRQRIGDKLAKTVVIVN